MEITWKHSFKQIAQMLGVADKPWVVDAFWETDVSALLGGKQMGDIPMEELVQRKLMQNQPSIVSGFNFLQEKIRQGNCLHNIWDDAQRAADPQKVPTGLYAFPVQGSRRFLLIIPGGGYYNVCSFIEGFPFAQRCNELGISAFVLQYRSSSGAHYPNPQEDAAQAVRYILANRDVFGLGWIMGLSPELKKCPPDIFYPPLGRAALFESRYSPHKRKAPAKGCFSFMGRISITDLIMPTTQFYIGLAQHAPLKLQSKRTLCWKR